MPLTHWVCPPGVPTAGEIHEPEYCILECPHRCISPFLMTALTDAVRGNHHTGQYISATSLEGCVRKLKLERTVDYADEPSKQLFSFRGTIIHQVVENAATAQLADGKSLVDHGYVVEWNMQVGFCFTHAAFPLAAPLDPTDSDTWDIQCPHCDSKDVIVLGGTLDGLVPEWGGFIPAEGDEVGPNGEGILVVTLEDMKTAQDYAIARVVTGDKYATLHAQTSPTGVGHVRDSYVLQANVYRYLGERSRPPQALWDKGVRQLRFKEGRIQYFSMRDFPYTGSPYYYRTNWKSPYRVWDIATIEFFEDKWVENYIKESAWPIYQSLILDKERGDVCKADMHWLCEGFCPFYQSEYCPNPEKERLLLAQGEDKERAFEQALQTLEDV